MSYRSWLAQLIKDDGCCQSEAISYLWANPNLEDVLDYFASYFDLDTVRLEDVQAAAVEIQATTQTAISGDFPNEIKVWRCGNAQGDVTSVTTDKSVAERGCKGGYYGVKDSTIGSYVINRSDVLVSIEHFWPYGDFVEGELLVRPDSLQPMKETLLREYIRAMMLEQANPATSFMSDYSSNSQFQDDMGFLYWEVPEPCWVKTLVYPDKANPGGVYFEAIQTYPPECEGKGYASDIMNKITALADKHAITMRSTVKPFGSKRVDKNELMNWYTRSGFVKDKGGIMRLPQ